MKDIRIFVASSKELVAERHELAFLVLAKEDEFAKRGFRVRLAKWEYVDPNMTAERTEDRYLNEMYDCDAALVLFKDIAGMYTREELDKALAKEAEGKARLKTHRILFHTDGKPESDATKLKDSLPEGSYGTYSDMQGLRDEFLSLVDAVAKFENLKEVVDGGFREVSAFLAADDELAADRNAFADAILNLNDVLRSRGIRVRLRFYDPFLHREMLNSSEIALVLYYTKCGLFDEAALKESYDRSRLEQNPKRLYVFFRDLQGKPLDDSFTVFKDGFATQFGSGPCKFENVDTLSINFLFALENVLEAGAGTFVKLDGRMVIVDGLEIGDLTKLPMLEKNAGLADLFEQMDLITKRFVEYREKCEKDPKNDGLYVEWHEISAQKNTLRNQIDRELKMSFNLAKRLALISIAQVNETIAQARVKVEDGDINGAIEILDEASSAHKRRMLLQRAVARAEAEELQIKELSEYNQIELLRISSLMAYTKMQYRDRISAVCKIAYDVVDELSCGAHLFTVVNRSKISYFLDQVLLSVSSLPLEGVHEGHLVGFFRGVSSVFRLSSLALQNDCGIEQAKRILMDSADWDFTKFLASRAAADMETRDGWDRLDATVDICKYVNLCRCVGLDIPIDAQIVLNRIKLLVGYEDMDPTGGMTNYSRLIEEAETVIDLCELRHCEGNHYITTEELKELAGEFNTVWLCFYYRRTAEVDDGIVSRAIENGADIKKVKFISADIFGD